MRTIQSGLCCAAFVSFCAFLVVPHVAAEAASTNGQTRTTVNQGVNITKNSDLHFGDFIAGTAQSRFRLDPDTEAVTQLSGNAISIGGTQTAASFTAHGSPMAVVRLQVRQNQINLVRAGGSETMRVDQFRLDGGNGTRNRRLGAGGTIDYRLGGRLTINPNQAGGAYVGSFEITLDYQ